ncbi:MAG: Autotransporter assembly factor TamB [Candidatus Accumulibacter appositus]|uniref:Autotransporter assembly factor TamB n=1 Tax=Candidatus Accumulibacter appositus TaxID=1454003 RepID=A0A011PVG4_9PROT|nr:translocation/assembly module TamB domain-containing protein [Accumulibacter sp.]EXI80830.1 MAG: Autotransporter assembly factor TamB [Candidatus Accumulibacter appositus]HRF06346.1 translocation/assembly module TamB domain-containing protein [Accumulibacter sp.]
MNEAKEVDEQAGAPGQESDVRQAVPPPRKPRRRWHWLWISPLAVGLGLLAGLAWLLATESGFRVACRALEELANGQLTLAEPSGSLRGSLSLQAVHWRDATLDVQLQDLQFDWRPAELLQARLSVSRLAAARLRVASVPSDEPSVMPDSLRLPLAVDIEELRLGSIELGEHGHPDGQATTVVEGLALRLSSDGAEHHVSELRATASGLALTGELSLAGDQPYALTAAARIEGEAAGRALVFDLLADGSLDELRLHGSGQPLDGKTGESFAGQVDARLKPFLPQPIVEVVAKVTGVDPAAWAKGAPQAILDLDVALQPLADSAAALSGRLTLRNRRSGAADKDLLPVESLQTALRLEGDELQLADLDLRLSGGGRLRGSGRLRDSELTLRLTAAALDARALFSSLHSTKLAGPLRASLGLNQQSFELELRDPQFSIASKIAIQPSEIVVDQLRLEAGDARLLASGQLGLVDAGKFAVQGSLKNFDPSRFADVPPARLNADFDGKGSSQPQLALGLRFQLHDSRFRGQSLAGRGDVDLVGERLRKADVELNAAGNRLTAKGAFGARGDHLTVAISAPKLDPLGVAGDVSGTLLLGGSVKSPELSADLRSTRLAAEAFGEIRGLDLTARLGDGKDGALSGKLQLAGLDLPDGNSLLGKVLLEAEGVRSAHRLRGQLALPGKRELRLLLAGGLTTPASGMQWAGALSELSVSSRLAKDQSFVRLAGPLPLQAAAERFSAGPAEFVGAGWSARLERALSKGQSWQTAGSLRGLPLLTMLAEFPEWFDASALGAAKGSSEALRLNADWDLGTSGGSAASGKRGAAKSVLPAGSVRLWRESGDLSIGSVALGLEEGSVSLLAKNGRLDAELKLRGKKLGELSGTLSAASSATTLISEHAPWRGQLKLDVPDLAWAARLLGEGWQLGGRLAGELALSGTPVKPRLSGEWRGDGLAMRALDHGMRLERGKLRLQLTGDEPGDVRLVLKQLFFESDFQAMPRSLALDPGIDAASLTGKPGSVEASGELHLGTTDGVLTLRADRLGVTQLANQWMLVSGEAKLTLGQKLLDVLGKFKVDAGYWELAKSGTPQLSDDVRIERKGEGKAKAPAAARLLSLNIDADLGSHFRFRGAGVESRLAGSLKIESDGTGLPRATGSIRTVGGRFDAYGQKLAIERGILNFQGLIDNPGLNIRAIRTNLPVEAGVEVTGTARRPVVKLVSDPVVPDAEKLSWLVLGHASDQGSGGSGSVLMAAAQTLFGGQDGGTLGKLQRSLGIDEFGVSGGSIDGSSRSQTSSIASSSSFGSSNTTTGQIVSVGKRLSSDVVISYDQSLTTAESVVKLTYYLNRSFYVVGRAGSDNALDFFWKYRFGR